MKAKAMMLVLGAAGVLAAGLACAQSGADVVKAKGCLNCHEADKKKIGPAYKEVAAKYKDDKGAEASLIAKLKNGTGHPKIAASDAELKAAVGHVLSTK
jgi:cytochrome c